MWADAIIVIAFTAIYFLSSFKGHKEKEYILPAMFLVLALFSLEEPYVFLYVLAAAFVFLGQRGMGKGNGGKEPVEETEENEAGEEEEMEEGAGEGHGGGHEESAHGAGHH
ncbi:MAG: hypothetical protein ABID38_04540 [Candidatus Diapherotrites archaeon]